MVGLAEYRLHGLQQGTPAPPMCRVPHCPFDAFHPVYDTEVPRVGCEGDGELFCAPGGFSFLTISHTGGQHSWQNFALVSTFIWLSCLRQLLVLASRKSCPCCYPRCCPRILFPLCNCSAAVRPICGHKLDTNYCPPQVPDSGCSNTSGLAVNKQTSSW